MKTQQLIITNYLINKMVKELHNKQIKKDYKAYRLYLRLSKSNSKQKIINLKQKINTHFYNKRQEEKLNSMEIPTNPSSSKENKENSHTID
jgi:ferritin